MRHRTVRELMTPNVVCVRREAAFKEIATLLAERGITAVPVVDDSHRPLGVVSEADLLRKEAGQPDPAGLLSAPRRRPGASSKAEAVTAEGLMSAPAVVARPQWTVVEAARVMEDHRVKRLPVVDDAERVIGIVSRSDLLRVFLRRDRSIRDEIVGDVLTRTLGLSREALDAIEVRVVDGRVALSGTVEHRSLIPVLVRLCRGADGVVDVADRLEYAVDDTVGAAADGR
jgi:CBS domain-containing protein